MVRAALILALAAQSNAETGSHPTLPTMWTATVNEAQVGVVHESYIFVEKPTAENPSAKWTNFTDGSCQRLIYDGNNYNQARYLLGCDSVDCCTEQQSGNHIEYQIPNIHPAFLAPVSSLGQESITKFDKETVVADVYAWKFGLATYKAYTTAGGHTLHRWVVSAEGNNYTNEYVNFTVPTDVAAFKSQFQVPAICAKASSCDGKVSAKSLAFLRAGHFPGQDTIIKLVCELASAEQIKDKATGEICKLIEKKIPVPDCTGLLDSIWDKVVAKCPKATVIV